MTPSQLTEIEQRANAATAGPWDVDTCSVIRKDIGPEPWSHPQVGGGFYGEICESSDYDDCRSLAFIAAARTDIPLLCAALREAWKERDAAALACETLRKEGNE